VGEEVHSHMEMVQERLNSLHGLDTVADLGGGVRGCFWWLVMYLCIHNCMSPSNDYAAVWHAATTTRHSYTLISVPY